MAPGLKARTFALLLYLSSNTLATTINVTPNAFPNVVPQSLQRRQNTCRGSRPVSCTAVDPKLSPNFCCPANTDCISLDASSSALCCPINGPCAAIEIISCNVALQNPTNPNGGPIITTRLNDRLPTCGNACCPFGYTCGTRADGSPFCKIDTARAITSTPPQPSKSTISNTPKAPTGTSTSTNDPSANVGTASVSPTMQASGIDSTNPESSKPSNPFPPGVFFAGFFPGMIVGALAVLAWVILTGRHRKDSAGVGSEYGKRPSIRDPYGEPRTNFISRTKSLGKSVFIKKDQMGTPGLPFDSADEWKTLTPPVNNNIPAPGMHIPAGPGASYSQADPMSTAYFNEVAKSPMGFSVAPSRPKSLGQGSDPTDDILMAYTPRKPTPAAVAPLRGMNSQRKSKNAGFESTYGSGEQAPRNARAQHSGPEDDESDYDYGEYPPSSPSLYSGGVSRRPTIGEASRKLDRRDTTFTEMLRQINFPDPSSKGDAPAMPSIPTQYQK